MFRLDTPGGVPLFLKHGDGEVADAIADEAARLRWLALWQNPAEHGAAAQRRFLARMGMDEPDPDRLAIHRCLDELF